MSGDRRRPGPPLEAEGPSPAELHESVYREASEPRDGHEPPPVWLVFLYIVLMGFGGYYLGTYSGNWRADVYDERPRMAAPAEAGPAPTPDPAVLGRRTYARCMACHQKDGRGVPGTYPPLAGSEIVLGPPEVAAAIVLAGLEGPVEVAGQRFDNVMPSWARLGDAEIAAVLTYVRGSWGNDAPPVTPELVARVRAATAGRAAPLRAAELPALARRLVGPEAAAHDG